MGSPVGAGDATGTPVPRDRQAGPSQGRMDLWYWRRRVMSVERRDPRLNVYGDGRRDKTSDKRPIGLGIIRRRKQNTDRKNDWFG